MSDVLPTIVPTPKDRLHMAFRYRWPAFPIALACLVVALAGLAIPVSPPGGGVERASRSILAGNSPEAARAEDLTGFLAIDRWGAPIEQDEEAEPVEEPVDPVGLNPALQGIGFVGVTFMEDEYAVLLNLSAVTRQGPQGAQQLEAGMARLLAGDTLPDGRRLVAVTPDSLTLADSTGEEERHLLFGDWDESPE